MNVEKAELKNILIKELGFSEIAAELNSSHFPDLHEKLEGPMKKWLDDRSVEDVEVEGVTLREVMDAHGGKFLEAISGLNDLLVKDLTDEEREALKVLLKKPMLRA